jgi:hypothetical protein
MQHFFAEPLLHPKNGCNSFQSCPLDAGECDEEGSDGGDGHERVADDAHGGICQGQIPLDAGEGDEEGSDGGDGHQHVAADAHGGVGQGRKGQGCKANS